MATTARAALSHGLPFIRTLRVDTSNRPGYYRQLSDAVAAVSRDLRTEIIVSGGTYDLPVHIEGVYDLEIRGEADSMAILTSTSTTMHLSIPEESLVVFSGLRFETTNPLYPAILITSGTPIIRKCHIQSLHVDHLGSPLVDHCQISGSPSNGVTFTGSSSGELRACTFRGALLYHAIIEGSSRPSICSSQFYESGQGAIVCMGRQSAPTLSKCVIQDAPISSAEGDALQQDADRSRSSITAHSAVLVTGSAHPRAAVVISGGASPCIEDCTVFGGVGGGLAVFDQSFVAHKLLALEVALANVGSEGKGRRGKGGKAGKKSSTTAASSNEASGATVRRRKEGTTKRDVDNSVDQAGAPDDGEEETGGPTVGGVSASATFRHTAPITWSLGDHATYPSMMEDASNIRRNVFRDNKGVGVMAVGNGAMLCLVDCEVERNDGGGCSVDENGQLHLHRCTLSQHSEKPAVYAETARGLVRLNQCKVVDNHVGVLCEYNGIALLEGNCTLEDCRAAVHTSRSGIVDMRDSVVRKCSVAVRASEHGAGSIAKCRVESNGTGYESHCGGNVRFHTCVLSRNGTAVLGLERGRGSLVSCVLSDSTGSAQAILHAHSDIAFLTTEVRSAEAVALEFKSQARGVVDRCTIASHKSGEIVRVDRRADPVITACRLVGSEANVVVFLEGSLGTISACEIINAKRAAIVVKSTSECTIRGNRIAQNSIGIELLSMASPLLEKNIIEESNLANIVVVGHDPSKAPSAALPTQQLSVTVPRASISKNWVSKAELGIQCGTFSAAVVTRNIISACFIGIRCAADTARIVCAGNDLVSNTFGVALPEERSGGYFFGNTVRESARMGFWVASGACPVVAQNLFLGHAVSVEQSSSGAVPTSSKTEHTALLVPIPLRLDSGSLGTFSGNVFRYNSIGALLHPLTRAVLTQNTFVGNTIGALHAFFDRKAAARSGAAAATSTTPTQLPPYLPAASTSSSDRGGRRPSEATRQINVTLPDGVGSSRTYLIDALGDYFNGEVCDPPGGWEFIAVTDTAVPMSSSPPTAPAIDNNDSGADENDDGMEMSDGGRLTSQSSEAAGCDSEQDSPGALLLGNVFQNNHIGVECSTKHLSVPAAPPHSVVGSSSSKSSSYAAAHSTSAAEEMSLPPVLELDACVFANNALFGLRFTSEAVSVRSTCGLFLHRGRSIRDDVPDAAEVVEANEAGVTAPLRSHKAPTHVTCVALPASELTARSRSRTSAKGLSCCRSVFDGCVFAGVGICVDAIASQDLVQSEKQPQQRNRRQKISRRDIPMVLIGCVFRSSTVRCARGAGKLAILRCSFLGFSSYAAKLAQCREGEAVEYVSEPQSIEWCRRNSAFDHSPRLAISTQSFAAACAVEMESGASVWLQSCSIKWYSTGILANANVDVSKAVPQTSLSPGGSAVILGCYVGRCSEVGVHYSSGGDFLEVEMRNCVLASHYGTGLRVACDVGDDADGTCSVDSCFLVDHLAVPLLGALHDPLTDASLAEFDEVRESMLLPDVRHDEPHRGTERHPQQIVRSTWYPVLYSCPPPSSSTRCGGAGVGFAGVAVHLVGGGRGVLKNLRCIGSSLASVYVEPAANFTLDGCVLRDAVGYGCVVGCGASVRCTNSSILRNGCCGVLAESTSASTFADCVFEGNRVGLHGDGDSTIITRTLFVNHQICGLRAIRGSRLSVVDSLFEDNASGVEVVHAAPTIQRCEVQHSSFCGVVVSGSNGGDRGDNPQRPCATNAAANNDTPASAARIETSIQDTVLRRNGLAGVLLRSGAMCNMHRVLTQGNNTGIVVRTFSIVGFADGTIHDNMTGVLAEWNAMGTITRTLFKRSSERSFLSRTLASVDVTECCFSSEAPIAVLMEGRGTFTHNTHRMPRQNCFMIAQGGHPVIAHCVFSLLHAAHVDVVRAKLLEDRNPDELKTRLINDATTTGATTTAQGTAAAPPGLSFTSDAGAALRNSTPPHPSAPGGRSSLAPSGAVTPVPTPRSALVPPTAESSRATSPAPPPPVPPPREDETIDLSRLSALEGKRQRLDEDRLLANDSLKHLVKRKQSVVLHRAPEEAVMVLRERSASRAALSLERSGSGAGSGMFTHQRKHAALLDMPAVVGQQRSNVSEDEEDDDIRRLSSDDEKSNSENDDSDTHHNAGDNKQLSAMSRQSSAGGSRPEPGRETAVRQLSIGSLQAPQRRSSLGSRPRIASYRRSASMIAPPSRGSAVDSEGSADAPPLMRLGPRTELERDLLFRATEDPNSSAGVRGHIDQDGGTNRWVSSAGVGDYGDSIDGTAAQVQMESWRAAIVIEAGGLGLISNCLFSHNQPCSILCDGPSARPVIEHSLFYDHRVCSVVVTGGSAAEIRHCGFTRNANAVQVFHASGRDVSISDCWFRLNLSSVEAIGGDCGRIMDCVFLQDELSVLCSSGAIVKVAHSQFFGCDEGVIGEPNSILLLDALDLWGCGDAVTLQSDEPLAVNPVGHADATTEVLRAVWVRCGVNGIRAGNRRDTQIQSCKVSQCVLTGLELSAPTAEPAVTADSIGVPSSVVVVDTTVDSCRTGVLIHGDDCAPSLDRCCVTYCSDGIVCTGGALPTIHGSTVRTSLRGITVEARGAGFFRDVEVSGCECGIIVASGNENVPDFQRTLVYDCNTVGVHLQPGAAGKFVDGTVFECGVCIMCDERSYTALSQLKISHPGNNAVTKRNDALRMAKFSAPSLGPGIEIEYQGSPAHGSRTARMRRMDRERAEVQHHADLDVELASHSRLAAEAKSSMDTFLACFKMSACHMATIPVAAASEGDADASSSSGLQHHQRHHRAGESHMVTVLCEPVDAAAAPVGCAELKQALEAERPLSYSAALELLRTVRIPESLPMPDPSSGDPQKRLVAIPPSSARVDVPRTVNAWTPETLRSQRRTITLDAGLQLVSRQLPFPLETSIPPYPVKFSKRVTARSGKERASGRGQLGAARISIVGAHSSSEDDNEDLSAGGAAQSGRSGGAGEAARRVQLAAVGAARMRRRVATLIGVPEEEADQRSKPASGEDPSSLPSSNGTDTAISSLLPPLTDDFFFAASHIDQRGARFHNAALPVPYPKAAALRIQPGAPQEDVTREASNVSAPSLLALQLLRRPQHSKVPYSQQFLDDVDAIAKRRNALFADQLLTLFHRWDVRRKEALTAGDATALLYDIVQCYDRRCTDTAASGNTEATSSVVSAVRQPTKPPDESSSQPGGRRRRSSRASSLPTQDGSTVASDSDGVPAAPCTLDAAALRVLAGSEGEALVDGIAFLEADVARVVAVTATERGTSEEVAARLTPAWSTVAKVVLEKYVREFFDARGKSPDRDGLSILDVEVLISCARTGLLGTYLRLYFPWMAATDPMRAADRAGNEMFGSDAPLGKQHRITKRKTLARLR